MKKFFLLALISVAVILVGCDGEKTTDNLIPAEPKVKQHVEEPEKILNLGITIKEFKLEFGKIAVESDVSQLVLNESRRQYEFEIAEVVFLVAVAALNSALSPDERAEILNKLSKKQKIV